MRVIRPIGNFPVTPAACKGAPRLVQDCQSSVRPTNALRVADGSDSASTIADCPENWALDLPEIGGNDGGMPPAALLDQFEKDVGLLRFQIQVSKSVDSAHVRPRQTLETMDQIRKTMPDGLPTGV
jgi:hypothetical protein